MIDENFLFPKEDENGFAPVSFFCEGIDFELRRKEEITLWIESTIQVYTCNLNFVNFIFCSDDYLHSLNVSYLQHDTLTDIITFPYASPPEIEGELYISIERVHDNAKLYSVSFEDELLRVMIHGILHLCGFNDKTEAEKAEMRQRENKALNEFKERWKSFITE